MIAGKPTFMYRVVYRRTAIDQVEIEKESEHFIWIKGYSGRQAKDSNYTHYFHNREDAKTHLIKRCETRLRVAKHNVSSAEIELNRAEQL